MDYKNEHQRQMAILEAAMPYMEPHGRYAAKLLLQADSFASLARYGESPDLEAAETGASMPMQANPQEMLQSIQRFLTPREADLVQTILNFMNARRLFHNYSKFVQEKTGGTLQPMELAANALPENQNPLQMIFQMINGFGSLGRGLTQNNPEQNNMLRDFLLSQLNPEQKIAFEQLQNIMYNE